MDISENNVLILSVVILMDCFDVTLALNSLVAVSLIVAGNHLMMHHNHVTRGYGAYCFAFGYFILGVTASGQSLDRVNVRSRRYLLGVGSAIAVVAGSFMTQFHAKEHVKKLLSGHLRDYPEAKQDIMKAIPVIDHVLVYGGYAGLVLALALNDNNRVNYVRGALAVGAFAVIGYTYNRMLDSYIKNKDIREHQIAHILSWGLLVIATAYKC